MALYQGMFDQEPPTAAEEITAARSEADRDQLVETFNLQGNAPVLLLCDHAGRRVPPELENLGLPERDLA